jgi:hypothetical protein
MVSQDKSIDHKLLLDELYGSPDALIGGRQKTNQRNHQEAGVQVVRTIIWVNAPRDGL